MPRKNVAGIPGVDPTLPNVPLELDGETYQICYDFNAIAEYETLTETNCLG